MKKNKDYAWLLYLIILAIAVLFSCSKPRETVMPLELGMFYKGGIIFYIDASGQHGLIASQSDVGSGVWGCTNVAISGAERNGIGAGKYNTADIVNGCNEADIAAKVCIKCNENGYSDWYLPSYNELRLLYDNKQLVGGFTTDHSGYWSSTEIEPYGAWGINFTDGKQYYNFKDGIWNIRPVKSF